MDNYRFPMTEKQRKEIRRQKMEFGFWVGFFSLIVGLALGYAWRIAQGF